MKSAISIGWPLLCTFGLVVEHEFFRNVALGLVWFMSLFGVLAVYVAGKDDDDGAELRQKLRERPTWRKHFGRISDVPIALLLAGHGYWWAFGLFTLQALGSWGVEEKAEKEGSQEGTQ